MPASKTPPARQSWTAVPPPSPPERRWPICATPTTRCGSPSWTLTTPPAPPARTAPPPRAVAAHQAAQPLPQLLERRRSHGVVFAAGDGEADRPIERRQVPRLHAPRLALLEPYAHHTDALLDVVVQRDAVPVQRHRRGERVEPGAVGCRNGAVGIERDARRDEFVPRAHRRDLRRDLLDEPVPMRLREPAAGAPPIMPEALEGAAQLALVRVGRLAGEQRLNQRLPRGVGQLLRK